MCPRRRSKCRRISLSSPWKCFFVSHPGQKITETDQLPQRPSSGHSPAVRSCFESIGQTPCAPTPSTGRIFSPPYPRQEHRAAASAPLVSGPRLQGGLCGNIGSSEITRVLNVNRSGQPDASALATAHEIAPHPVRPQEQQHLKRPHCEASHSNSLNSMLLRRWIGSNKEHRGPNDVKLNSALRCHNP
jgi:hypothetical protein